MPFSNSLFNSRTPTKAFLFSSLPHLQSLLQSTSTISSLSPHLSKKSTLYINNSPIVLPFDTSDPSKSFLESTFIALIYWTHHNLSKYLRPSSPPQIQHA